MLGNVTVVHIAQGTGITSMRRKSEIQVLSQRTRTSDYTNCVKAAAGLMLPLMKIHVRIPLPK